MSRFPAACIAYQHWILGFQVLLLWTAWAPDMAAAEPDASVEYRVVKSVSYRQNGNEDPQMEFAAFQASILQSLKEERVVDPSFLGPDGKSLVSLERTGKQSWNFAALAKDPRDIDELFQKGSYVLNFSEFVALKLEMGTFESNLPNQVPQFIGKEWDGDTLRLNNEEDTVLEWKAFEGFSKSGVVTFSLTGKGLELHETFFSDKDANSPTSYRIIAGLLEAGQRYEVTLGFGTVVDSGFPKLDGALGYTEVANITFGSLEVIPEPSMVLQVFLCSYGFLRLFRRQTHKVHP